MKRISIILAGLLSFSVNASECNEEYGTVYITSDNGFSTSDEAQQAAIDESNGYFTAWDEAISTWKEQNGYWD